MSLSCVNICAGYGADSVLRDVSLELHPGEVLGIRGASGCGKTTLMRVLAGTLAPRDGSVAVDGRTLPAKPTAEMRRAHAAQVTLVQQLPEQQLFAATVYDEVAFGPRNLGVCDAELDARVDEALAAVGLDAQAIGNTSPFAHSGGERRRIAIADMLAMQAPYLLLDEPTAGLDPRGRAQLMARLRACAQAGTGIVVVSHDERALADLCDRVLTLEGGRLTDDVNDINGDSIDECTENADTPMAADPAVNASTFAFGAYRPGFTLAHRLHPAVKIVFCLLFLIAAFVAQGAVALAAVAVTAGIALAASGTMPRQILRSLKPFAWIMLFVLAFNALFTASGAALLQLGPVALTTGGLAFGATSVLRFTLVLLGTSTLMATTSPTQLADGAAILLRPLARAGAHIDDLVLALQLTLRFVPLLSQELARIKAAQEARLADFSAASPFARARAYVPVIVPLFAGALRRSETLALAIQNREYGAHPGTPRTCIRTYPIAGTDIAALAASVALLIAALFL